MKDSLAKYVSFFVSITLVSCTTMGNVKKKDVGTVAGAIGGGIVGAAVSNKKYRAGAIILGSVLGGIIGNRIGNALDERDRKSLEKKTEEALNTAKTGETVVWKSDHTEATAEITPVQESIKYKRASIKKTPEVVIISSPIQVESGFRRTLTELNVRSGPGTSYNVVRILPSGHEVSIHGVTNSGWYMVGEKGVVIGYVYGKYLHDVSMEKRRTYAPREKEMYVKTSIPVDESSQSRQSSSEEGPVPQEEYIEEVTATVKVKCRTVIVRTKVDGKVVEEKVKTCQDPNGSWGA